MTVTLSVITATSGRPTLTRTLESLAAQMGDGDELLVLRRDQVPWGNATRDDAIARAAGSHLWWMDDDDVAADGAFETIRRNVAVDPGTVHIFRMDMVAQGRVMWADPVFECGLVGGPMCVVPNIPGKLGVWLHTQAFKTSRQAWRPGECGDYHFVAGTLEKLNREPAFHEDIIARIRP